MKSLKYYFSLLFLVSFLGINSQEFIRVYFNQPVDNSYSSVTDAVYSSHLDDTIVSYINNAQQTIDFCNYNTSRAKIIDALNDAHERGLKVRYIAAKNAFGRNKELENLAGGIEIVQRDEGRIGAKEMHNKFFVFDGNDSLLATSITGSMNHTESSIEKDYNHLLIIKHYGLAQAYKTEFDEMWGGNFGDDKTDNTAHHFMIDGKEVELYFVPSDNVLDEIYSRVNTADYSIDVAMMTFADDNLGNLMIEKHQEQKKVAIIIERERGGRDEQFKKMKKEGLFVLSHRKNDGVLHHKYAIIDGNEPTSDPMVITGSTNWNSHTENDYDDNTIVIHDYEIAQQFLEEFNQRLKDIEGWKEQQFLGSVYCFPNPAEDILQIKHDSSTLVPNFYLTSLTGEKIISLESQNIILSNKTEMNLTNISQGFYLLFVEINGYRRGLKLVKK